MQRDNNALNPFGFLDRLYIDERPSHAVYLPSYLIDKYEVTNAQYRQFLLSSQREVPYSWVRSGLIFSRAQLASLPMEHLRDAATHRFRLDMNVPMMSRESLLIEMDKVNQKRSHNPVTSVNWFSADAYCKWAGKRLPSEAEWEKAARGPKGLEYPWGNKWDLNKINTMSDNDEEPYSAVGSYPDDKSPYGVYDMAANVAEWTADWYDAYANAPASENKYFGEKQRVVRGGVTSSGHYDSVSLVFRSAKRTHLLAGTALIDLGFNHFTKDYLHTYENVKKRKGRSPEKWKPTTHILLGGGPARLSNFYKNVEPFILIKHKKDNMLATIKYNDIITMNI
jgi:formylglycine-generating enzyme required for sulfatase activity